MENIVHKSFITNRNFHTHYNKKLLYKNSKRNRINPINFCNSFIFSRGPKRINNPNIFRNNPRVYRIFNNVNPLFQKQGKNKLLPSYFILSKFFLSPGTFIRTSKILHKNIFRTFNTYSRLSICNDKSNFSLGWVFNLINNRIYLYERT